MFGRRNVRDQRAYLDVERSRLFEAGPRRVLGMDVVDAALVDDDAAGEALVVRLDAQLALPPIKRVRLDEVRVVDADDLQRRPPSVSLTSGVMGFYWVSLDFTGFYWFSLDVIEFYWV